MHRGTLRRAELRAGVVLLIALLCLLAVSAVPAGAQEPDPSEGVITENGVESSSSYTSGCGDSYHQWPAEPGTAAAEGDSEQQCSSAYRKITRSITFYCQQKNWLGQILWRYNSRWTWTFGTGRGIIHRATHTEWGSHTTLGWRYNGSRYLEGYGAVGTTLVGRTVLGTFEFAPAGTYIRTKSIRLRAGVSSNTSAGYGMPWGPWCLD
jgi:hypothetical protein